MKLQHMIRSIGSVGLEIASGGDFKAKLPQKEAEYVATWDLSRSEAVDRLREMGYSYQPFAARKFLDGYGRDDGSFSKRDPNAGHLQYHVHIYDTRSGIEVYCHHEYRVGYPRAHYEAILYRMGVTCGDDGWEDE